MLRHNSGASTTSTNSQASTLVDEKERKSRPRTRSQTRKSDGKERQTLPTLYGQKISKERARAAVSKVKQWKKFQEWVNCQTGLVTHHPGNPLQPMEGEHFEAFLEEQEQMASP